MRFKHLIVMITVMLLFLCGRLAAEEIVGTSIFPCIETPHPYPQPEGNGTLVWSTTIEEPGAAWIKIHFSSFQLNDKDFVNLIDEQERIIEHIRFRDVCVKHNSRFKFQQNSDQTVNFWTLAVDGQKIRVELHRESNNPTGLGFTINEIGVGSKPLFDIGLGPVYNNDQESSRDFLLSPEKKSLNFSLSQMIAPYQAAGRMLYKKGTTWYTCKGNLLNGGKNEFLPREDCIQSQDVVDTLEVRFYIHYNLNNNDFPVYQSFYGDRFIHNYLDNEYGLVTLKRNMKMGEFYNKDGEHFNQSQQSEIYCLCCCTWHYCPICKYYHWFFYLCPCPPCCLCSE
jgi:hypothetical protein